MKLLSGSEIEGVFAAEMLARIAHSGQTRRDGITDYISHLESVVSRLKEKGANETEIAVGWLHDVLEDSHYTKSNLLDMGFHFLIVEAVDVLTKKAGQNYEDYLEGVKANSIATKVKVADMLSNLSDTPTRKQILKYSRGLIYLLSN